MRDLAYSPRQEEYQPGDVITASGAGNPPPDFTWTDLTSGDRTTGDRWTVTAAMLGDRQVRLRAVNTIPLGEARETRADIRLTFTVKGTQRDSQREVEPTTGALIQSEKRPSHVSTVTCTLGELAITYRDFGNLLF